MNSDRKTAPEGAADVNRQALECMLAWMQWFRAGVVRSGDTHSSPPPCSLNEAISLGRRALGLGPEEPPKAA